MCIHIMKYQGLLTCLLIAIFSYIGKSLVDQDRNGIHGFFWSIIFGTIGLIIGTIIESRYLDHSPITVVLKSSLLTTLPLVIKFVIDILPT